jgi:hypothetical protein
MYRQTIRAALGMVLALFCCVPVIGWAGDLGAHVDFLAHYRVVSMQPAGAVTMRVQLIVDLQNTGAVAVNRAVLELDGMRPAPTVQSFASQVSLARGATVTLSGTFIVNTADARAWVAGIRAAGPMLILVGLDASGQPSRRGVQIQSFPIGR